MPCGPMMHEHLVRKCGSERLKTWPDRSDCPNPGTALVNRANIPVPMVIETSRQRRAQCAVNEQGGISLRRLWRRLQLRGTLDHANDFVRVFQRKHCIPCSHNFGLTFRPRVVHLDRAGTVKHHAWGRAMNGRGYIWVSRLKNEEVIDTSEVILDDRVVGVTAQELACYPPRLLESQALRDPC